MKTLIVLLLMTTPCLADGWTCNEVHRAVVMAGSVKAAKAIARTMNVAEVDIKWAETCIDHRPHALLQRRVKH